MFTFFFFKIYFDSKGAPFQSYVSRGCVSFKMPLRNIKNYFEEQNKNTNFLPSSLGELLVSPTLVEHSADHLQSRGQRDIPPERSTALLILNQTLCKASFCMHSYFVNVYSPVQINQIKYQSLWAGWRNPLQTTSSSPQPLAQIFLWDEISGVASLHSPRRREKLSLCASGF